MSYPPALCSYDDPLAHRNSAEGPPRGWGPQAGPAGRPADRVGPGPVRTRDEGRSRREWRRLH